MNGNLLTVLFQALHEYLSELICSSHLVNILGPYEYLSDISCSSLHLMCLHRECKEIIRNNQMHSHHSIVPLFFAPHEYSSEIAKHSWFEEGLYILICYHIFKGFEKQVGWKPKAQRKDCEFMSLCSWNINVILACYELTNKHW